LQLCLRSNWITPLSPKTTILRCIRISLSVCVFYSFATVGVVSGPSRLH
jgi:hypothetical protein